MNELPDKKIVVEAARKRIAHKIKSHFQMVTEHRQMEKRDLDKITKDLRSVFRVIKKAK